MTYLTKQQILEAKDIRYVDVEVPEWGGKVRVKMMTGTERDAYEASLYEVKAGADGKSDIRFNREDMRCKLLARVIVDEQGRRLFADAEIRTLGQKSAAALERVYKEAQRLNALDDEAVAAAEKK